MRYIVAISVALSAMAGWLYTHDRKVERHAISKIKKVTNNAKKKGKRAADKSLSGRVSGVRDPTTRDD